MPALTAPLSKTQVDDLRSSTPAEFCGLQDVEIERAVVGMQHISTEALVSELRARGYRLWMEPYQ